MKNRIDKRSNADGRWILGTLALLFLEVVLVALVIRWVEPSAGPAFSRSLAPSALPLPLPQGRKRI